MNKRDDWELSKEVMAVDMPKASSGPTRMRLTVAYVIAIVGTAAVLAAHLWLWNGAGDPVFTLFLFPVFVSAFWGGARPGLLATTLGALGADYLLLPPFHSFWIAGKPLALEWLTLLISGCAISVLGDALRRQKVRSRAVEAGLQESERRLSAMVNSAMDGIIAIDAQQRIVLFNPAAEMMFKCAASEALGQSLDRFIPERFRSAHVDHVRAFGQTHVTHRAMGHLGQIWGLRTSGEEFPLEASISHSEDSGQELFKVILRDVTDRQRAECALRESEEKFRSLVSNVPGVVWTVSAEMQVVFMSEHIQTLSGYSVAEIYQRGPQILRATLHPDDLPKVDGAFRALFQERRPFDLEYRVKRADGRWIWVHDRSHAIYEKNGMRRADGLLSDISDRKRTEQELRRLNRALRTTSDCNQVLVRAKEEIRFLKDICNLLVGEGGYRTAWVGYAEHDDGKSVRPVAHSGSGADYLHSAGIVWADVERGRGPTGTAIRDGKPVMIRDYNEDPAVAVWREAALRHGYASAIALPIRVNDRVIGALTLYRGEAGGFETAEVELLSELSSDLGYGIQTLRARREHEQAEDELRFWTALLEAQSEATLDGILVSDSASRVLLVNRQFGRMWNTPEDVLQAKDGKALFELTLSQLRDPEGIVEGVKRLNASPAENARDEIELKDGRVFDRYSSSLQDPTGRFHGRIWFFRDITAEKQAELALRENEMVLRLFVRDAPATIAMLDREMRYLAASQRWMTDFHLGDRDVHGLRHDEVVSNMPERWNAALQRCLAGQVERCEEEAFPRVNGQVDWLRWEVRPWRKSDDSIGGVIIFSEIITDRKSLENQFRQAQKMEAVGRLAGGVAHDFNNLLTIINGYSELALDGLDSTHPLRDSMNEIKKAGERAASLTRQLLAFSRQQVLSLEIVDLNARVSDVEKMLRRLIGEDIELTVVRDPALGQVKADPGQIDQVLLNLAVNARDAMPEGGKLTIESVNVDLDEAYATKHVMVPAGQYVMLAISDTGVGMTAEIQSRIFEPFFTTKETGKGTGLGLAMVYGTVKQSGGFIWVYSEPGQGTTFKIYLPRVVELVGAAPPVEARGKTGTGVETILLVEDEEGVRSLALKILESLGYKVLVSESPEDAVLIGAQYEESIDLLITDVVMPGMSGRKVAERLLVLRPNVKVLYISGYTDNSVFQHGMLDLASAFLQKPFTPSGLGRKVRELLDTRCERKPGPVQVATRQPEARTEL